MVPGECQLLYKMDMLICRASTTLSAPAHPLSNVWNCWASTSLLGVNGTALWVLLVVVVVVLALFEIELAYIFKIPILSVYIFKQLCWGAINTK